MSLEMGEALERLQDRLDEARTEAKVAQLRVLELERLVEGARVREERTRVELGALPDEATDAAASRVAMERRGWRESARTRGLVLDAERDELFHVRKDRGRFKDAVDRVTEERDAWRSLAITRAKVRAAELSGDVERIRQARREHAWAHRGLRDLGVAHVTGEGAASAAVARDEESAPPGEWRGILAGITPAVSVDQLRDAYARGCAAAVDLFAPRLEQAERERDQARAELAKRPLPVPHEGILQLRAEVARAHANGDAVYAWGIERALNLLAPPAKGAQ